MSEKTVDQYTPAPDLLAGRTILITGAGDGIGRTAALTLANHQATVILLGRTAKKLEHVYDQIEQAGTPRPAIVTLDLSRATVEDYEKLAKTVEGEFGHLDGLIQRSRTWYADAAGLIRSRHLVQSVYGQCSRRLAAYPRLPTFAQQIRRCVDCIH